MPLQPMDNYLLPLPDPTEQIRKNMETVQNQQRFQQQGQLVAAQVAEHQAKVAAEQQKMERQQRTQDDLAVLRQNMTPEAIAAFSVAHPEMGEQMTHGFKMLTETEQTAQMSIAEKLHMAMLKKQPGIARDVALEASETYKNSGDAKRTAEFKGLADAIEKNPTDANIVIGSFVAKVKGFDEYLKAYKGAATMQDDIAAAKSDAEKKASDATSAAAEARHAEEFRKGQAGKSTSDAVTAAADASVSQPIAEARRIKAQQDALAAGHDETVKHEAARTAKEEQDLKVREARAKAIIQEETAKNASATEAAKLAKLTRDKFSAPLSVAAEKIIDASDGAIASLSVKAATAAELASKYDKMSSSGAPARVAEALRTFWGDQTEYDATRTRYRGLRAMLAVEGLPPGAASDADMKLALEGFLVADASPKLLASYLRGMEKLERAKIERHLVKKAWVTYNRHSGPATEAFTVRGRPVFPGDDMDDIARLTPKEAVERAVLIKEIEAKKKKAAK